MLMKIVYDFDVVLRDPSPENLLSEFPTRLNNKPPAQLQKLGTCRYIKLRIWTNLLL